MEPKKSSKMNGCFVLLASWRTLFGSFGITNWHVCRPATEPTPGTWPGCCETVGFIRAYFSLENGATIDDYPRRTQLTIIALLFSSFLIIIRFKFSMCPSSTWLRSTWWNVCGSISMVTMSKVCNGQCSLNIALPQLTPNALEYFGFKRTKVEIWMLLMKIRSIFFGAKKTFLSSVSW